LRAAAKMTSVVTLIIEKKHEKNIQKKYISDLPTLIFSRYETGTTGIFFTPWEVSRRPSLKKYRIPPCIFQVVASLPTKLFLLLALPAQTIQVHVFLHLIG
jgi:hypothetical protein